MLRKGEWYGHIEVKSYKFKFLGKLTIQCSIKIWFEERSRVWASSPQFAFPQFISLDMNSNFVYLFACRYRPHVRESVKEYDMHIEIKSYKLKLLENLIIKQQLGDSSANSSMEHANNGYSWTLFVFLMASLLIDLNEKTKHMVWHSKY